jgi:acetylornithine deacetylase
MEPSIYAAQCRAVIERRTLPGESGEYVVEQVRRRLDTLAATRTNFRAGTGLQFERLPFEVRPDSRLLPALQHGYAQIMGQPPVLAGIPFWTDAAFLAASGADTLLIGPTGDGLHSEVEWIDLGSCASLAAVLAETAVGYCGGTADR